MIVLHASLKLAQGERPRFEELLAGLVAPSRAEAGCLSYRVFQSLEAADEVIFVEEWKSREALELHFQTPHFRGYDAAVKALVAAPPAVRLYEVASHQDR